MENKIKKKDSNLLAKAENESILNNNKKYKIAVSLLSHKDTCNYNNNFTNESKIEKVRVAEKAFLTLEEASQYFNIGKDKLRKLSDVKNCSFVLFNGSKRLINRKRLETFLEEAYSI